jgi:hypothetical protein
MTAASVRFLLLRYLDSLVSYAMQAPGFMILSESLMHFGPELRRGLKYERTCVIPPSLQEMAR